MARPRTRQTKYGTQPLREAVWDAGYSHTQFAEMLNIRPMSHVRLAMYGDCPPSLELRRQVVAVLGKPLEELFTAKALAARYLPARSSRGPKPKKASAE